MPRSHVLRAVRLGPDPVHVHPERLLWPGSGRRGPEEAREEPAVYTESEMAAVRAEVEVARSEAEAARQQIREEGIAEGLARGREEEREVLRGEAMALETVAAGILAERSHLIAKAGRDLIQLALGMAERILRRSLDLDEEVVLRAVREALTHVGETRRVVIRINPREMDLIRDRARELRERVPEGAHLEFRPDPAISPGGCSVDTPELHLDATVEGLLDRFEETLTSWSDRQALGSPAVMDEEGTSDAA